MSRKAWRARASEISAPRRRRCSRRRPSACVAWRWCEGPRSSAPSASRRRLGLSTGPLELEQRRELVEPRESALHRPCPPSVGSAGCVAYQLAARSATSARNLLEVSRRTSAKRACLHEHVAERRRLDRSGEHGKSAAVGRELAQQPVLSARRRRCGRSRTVAGQAFGARRARGERLARGSRRCCARAPPRSDGARQAPFPCSSSPMRAGMSPGGRKRGSSASNTVGSAVIGTRPREAAPRGRLARRLAPTAASISLSSHRPITLVRNRMRPSTPPSLVKFAVPGLVGEDRALELDARPAPRCRRRCRPRRPAAIGTATTAEAVSCEPTAVTVRPGTPIRCADVVGQKRADRSCRESTTAGSSRRGRPSSSMSSRSHSPVAASSRPVVDAFVRSATDRPVSQYPIRSGTSSRSVGLEPTQSVGGELVERVERQELQAVAAVELVERRRSSVHAVDARGASARRGSGTARRAAAVAQQAVVDRPRVDADAR